ncbi:MAG: tetratricopeptide repeat protein, partial [Pyrinomonadaceae bacterium]
FYLFIKRNLNNAPTVNGVIFAQEIPKEAQKAYEKALSEFRDNNKKEAVEGFLQALDIFPDYFLALEKLGQEYIVQKKFEDARSIFNRAVIINPKSFDSWYGLAYSQNALKDYSESINSSKKAIELNSGSINALYLVALNQKQIGNYQEALDSLKKAKKIANPPLPEIFWQLALLYTNNFKNYVAAVQELELFLKAKPDYEDADKVRELIKKLKAK